MKLWHTFIFAGALFIAATFGIASAWEETVGPKGSPKIGTGVEMGILIDSPEPIQPPTPLKQGTVSTSYSSSSTWLGGWGTGGSTGTGSWWFRYLLQPYESISWIIRLYSGSTNYNLYLRSYPNPNVTYASATRTTYPDTLRYTNGANQVWTFFEVRYTSGTSGGVFAIENVRRPTTSSNPITLDLLGLKCIPRSLPTDGIEGYIPSSSETHWYRWQVPTIWRDSTFVLCVRLAGAGNYDLYVYDSNLTQITYARGTSYPDTTARIDGRTYYGQTLYLNVTGNGTNAEYRIDNYRVRSGVEENSTATGVILPLRFSIFPHPVSARATFLLQGGACEKAEVRIYDLRGSLMRSLTIPTNRPAFWDLRSDGGKRLSPGVYFLRATTGDFTATEKVVITR